MSDVVVLADHSVLLAIPAFAPAVVVAGVVIYIAMRDRRRSDTPQGEISDASGHDDSP
ncbi:MAG TPA: hypothetical protein VJ777_14275 [Mycobacterium sp.]|nr:hypothetical protein [Mycobacterium sp.]